ncbi:diguanylate phosphodiesterase [Granulicella tundricola MP5ACTX9]|uniref:Diguanylate phosphodiesterase n=2 Tax=Granulicella TaxID=940557 RepID=E8WY24_GRATM|nr:diguanylate phosphodiesterase [Granulicella tundricola MP5ACTX9]
MNLGLTLLWMSGPELIAPKCSACKDGVKQPFPMTMAFQPIVDVLESRVYAYEALVRGIKNEPAGVVMAQLTEENRYAFDQSCRVAAITLAARLGLKDTGAKLSINFKPGAVYSPSACIRLTLETARALEFPLDLLIFEITEMEEIKDRNHVLKIAQEYRRHGFQMAIDDFGSGYSGLNLLADLTPEILKLDMDLTRNLHERPTALAIVRSTVELCRALGVTCIAEGVETLEELRALRSCGIRLMQGYLLARPAFEALPTVQYPDSCDVSSARDAPSQTLTA